MFVLKAPHENSMGNRVGGGRGYLPKLVYVETVGPNRTHPKLTAFAVHHSAHGGSIKDGTQERMKSHPTPVSEEAKKAIDTHSIPA